VSGRGCVLAVGGRVGQNKRAWVILSSPARFVLPLSYPSQARAGQSFQRGQPRLPPFMLICPGCPAHLAVLRRAPRFWGGAPLQRTRAYIFGRVGQSTPTARISPIEALKHRPTRAMPRTPPPLTYYRRSGRHRPRRRRRYWQRRAFQYPLVARHRPPTLHAVL
jgi:hypothetical protein